jgi:hypothetical protein
MAPLAGQEIIKRSAATKTTSVPRNVNFGFMHRDAFRDWVSFDLQLL